MSANILIGDSPVAMLMFWLYMAATIGVGIYCRKYSTDMTGFMVGNRDLGPWFLGCAYFATYMSSSVLLGNAGTAYRNGMCYMWNSFTQTMCIPLGLIILGSGLMKASKQLGVITVPEYLKKRYRSNFPSAFLAVMMVIFLIPYLIGIIKGCALMLETVTNIKYSYCVWLVVGVTIVYTMIGGFMAGAITDFFQALLMCFGASMVFILGLVSIGGFGNMVEGLRAIDTRLLEVPGPELGWQNLVGLSLVFGIAPWGLPQLIQKFFAMRDKRVIRPSVYVVLLLLVLVLFTSNANGCIGRVMFGDQFMEGTSSDNIFPAMVVALLPEAFQGLVLAAVAAAAMSTLDGVILVMGAAVGKDFYQGVVNKKATDKQAYMVTQVTMVAVLLLLAFLSQNVPSQITFLATFSHSMMASMIMAPVLFGVFWKNATTAGCIASQLCGVGAAVIWYAIGQPLGLHFFIPAIILAFASFVIVSKCSKPMPKEFIELLFPSGEKGKEFHWGQFNYKMAKTNAKA